MTLAPDLYRVLQVDPAAEPEVIRAAYVCLAKKYHPDAANGSGERMVALNEAWAVLGNPLRRAAYDRSRSVPAAPLAPGPAATSQGVAPAAAARPGGTRPRGSAGGRNGTTLDFGRYAGWSLAALAHADPEYLEWLARVPIGMQYRAEIYALLAGRRPTPGAAQDRGRSRASPRPGHSVGTRPSWHLWPKGDR
jgi:curved DNA-binding protein CbpA